MEILNRTALKVWMDDHRYIRADTLTYKVETQTKRAVKEVSIQTEDKIINTSEKRIYELGEGVFWEDLRKIIDMEWDQK